MNNSESTNEEAQALQKKLMPVLSQLMWDSFERLLDDSFEHYQYDTAVIDPGSIYIGTWGVRGMALVVRTLGNYPDGEMLAVYGLSHVSTSRDEYLPLMQCRWLALNQQRKHMIERLRAIAEEFRTIFDKHDCIEGACWGMRELALPLLGGVSVNLLLDDEHDPLHLSNMMRNQFYQGWPQTRIDKDGMEVWLFEGSYLKSRNLLAIALDVPDRPEVADLLCGRPSWWAAAKPLKDFLELLEDPQCLSRFRDDPLVAGAALYAALVQWERMGFPIESRGKDV